MQKTGDIIWKKISDVWYQKTFINKAGMPTYTYYYKSKLGNPCTVCQIDIPISRQLCGYMLIEKDIRDSLDSLEGYIKIFDGENALESKSILKALIRSIVITYGKCFVKADARKIKLNDNIISLKNKDAHEELMRMRNEYVAHSGSPIYENCTFVFLLPPEKNYKRGQKVEAGTCTELHQVITFSSFAQDYKRLIEELHERINVKISSLKERMDREITMISPKAYYNLTKSKQTKIILEEKEWKDLQTR